MCIQFSFSSTVLNWCLKFTRDKVFHLENNKVSIFLKDNTATNSGSMQVAQSELEYDFIVALQDARDVPQ